MVDIFVSYCQKDAEHVEAIESYFYEKGVMIHRDVRDIGNWESIKSYMKKIRKTDYAILLITDNYLKSKNCMYEVLEVMKDEEYGDRIFPIVLEHSIYDLSGKAAYVKFWEAETEKSEEYIRDIRRENLGPLPNELKLYKNIASSVADFLTLVADTNNPPVDDAPRAIEERLIQKGALKKTESCIYPPKANEHADLYSSLRPKAIEFSDYEKNQFALERFKQTNLLLQDVCLKLEQDNPNIKIETEQIDSRAWVYTFYKNGSAVRTLKISLGAFLGHRNDVIGISENRFNNGTSFNGIYSVDVEDRALYFKSMLTFSSSKISTPEDLVKDIWRHYIQVYL